MVADEVPNLATHASDAAKNTADLIQGTVKKVSAGSELVTNTNDAFTEVAQISEGHCGSGKKRSREQRSGSYSKDNRSQP